MSEAPISYNTTFDVAKQANNVQRVKNLEVLKLIERLDTMQKIKKSSSRLEIKKFMFQLQQRMFEEDKEPKTNFREQAQKSVEKLKRDSKLSRSPDSRMTTADKPSEFIQIEVQPFEA